MGSIYKKGNCLSRRNLQTLSKEGHPRPHPLLDSYPCQWVSSLGIPDGPAIALYGQKVRNRVTEWLASPEGCKGSVTTYYGRQTAHELLGRTTWHAAQHLRQIYLFLQRMGVTPDHPLTEEDYKGLPIPKEVWS
jgi:hypothetical protein